MELGMILIIMFTGRISATITFFTLVLICHALKLISVLVMPVNQLSFPGVLWSDVDVLWNFNVMWIISLFFGDRYGLYGFGVRILIEICFLFKMDADIVKDLVIF